MSRVIATSIQPSQQPLQLFDIHSPRRLQSAGEVRLQRRPLRCHLGREAVAAPVLRSTHHAACHTSSGRRALQ
jgi:hypothetical protein